MCIYKNGCLCVCLVDYDENWHVHFFYRGGCYVIHKPDKVPI